MALAMRSYRHSMWRLNCVSPLTRGYVSLGGKHQALNSSLLLGVLGALGRCCCRRRRRDSASALANASLPADLAAQVVKASLAHVAVAQHVDLVDAGRVDHESPLDADAVSDTPHREVLAQAAARDPDDCAFENLDSLARALDDFRVHLYGVARAKRR